MQIFGWLILSDNCKCIYVLLLIWPYIGEGDLNKGQREAIETALIADNKLLLVQGPPGKLKLPIL